MIIKFSNFSNGIHQLEFREPAGNLNLSTEFIDDVQLNCEMDKSLGQVVLNCKVEAVAHLTCDRCTKEFDQSVNHEFKMIYMIDKEHNEEEGSYVHYLSPDQDKVDLSDDVSELTTLALPLKHLCEENCLGLCATCGKDLNSGPCNCKDEEINPIWEPLQKLKDKLK